MGSSIHYRLWLRRIRIYCDRNIYCIHCGEKCRFTRSLLFCLDDCRFGCNSIMYHLGDVSKKVGICKITSHSDEPPSNRDCTTCFLVEPIESHDQCIHIWWYLYGDYYTCDNISTPSKAI